MCQQYFWSLGMVEAVAQRFSVKQLFLEISQNSQEKTCARVSYLIKLFFKNTSGDCFWNERHIFKLVFSRWLEHWSCIIFIPALTFYRLLIEKEKCNQPWLTFLVGLPWKYVALNRKLICKYSNKSTNPEKRRVLKNEWS